MIWGSTWPRTDRYGARKFEMQLGVVAPCAGRVYTTRGGADSHQILVFRRKYPRFLPKTNAGIRRISLTWTTRVSSTDRVHICCFFEEQDPCRTGFKAWLKRDWVRSRQSRYPYEEIIVAPRGAGSAHRISRHTSPVSSATSQGNLHNLFSSRTPAGESLRHQQANTARLPGGAFRGAALLHTGARV
jgi:hypothetical protein